VRIPFSSTSCGKEQQIERSCFVPYTEAKIYKTFVMCNKDRIETKIYVVTVNKKLYRNGHP